MPIPTNPFSYTSRDFEEIYLELKSKYPNKPEWFIVMLSGMFDIMHWYLDARAQNLLLSTAYTEEAIRDLAAYLDFYPTNKSSGGGQVRLFFNSPTYPIVVPKNQLIWSVTTSTGSVTRFESIDDLVVNSGSSAVVTVAQGNTVYDVEVGTSDGITEFQEFTLPSINVVIDTIQAVINDVPWSRVDSLVSYTSSDKVFRVISKPSGVMFIQFGDGVYGQIPPNFPVLISYRDGGGIEGNVKARGTYVDSFLIATADGISENLVLEIDADTVESTLRVTVNGDVWSLVSNLDSSLNTDKHYFTSRAPDGALSINFGDGVNGVIPYGDIAVTYYRANASTVTYAGSSEVISKNILVDDFSGGKDKESLQKIKKLAPMMLRTNYRAVTESDYESLAEQYSAAIVKAKCFPGYYGAGTVGVHFIPSGGGQPSQSLKLQVETYLRDRSTLGSVDVRVRNPIYLPMDITVALQMRPGYSFAQYQQYATLALRLLTSEVTQELVEVYQTDGIAPAVVFINSKWSYGFSSPDYSEISRIILRRIREEVNLWGADFRVNDVISVLDDLTGVRYVNSPIAPVSNVFVAFDVLMTDGVMTVTQSV